MRKFLSTVFVLLAAFSPARVAAQDSLANASFNLRLGAQGITGLQRPGDAFMTDYIAKGRSLGDVLVRYRMEKGRWQQVAATRMSDRKAALPSAEPKPGRRDYTYFDKYYLYHGDFNDHFADLELVVRFRLEDEALVWTLHLRNLADQPLEVGDLALRLPFNTELRWDKTEMLTKRVFGHKYVSGHGSFLFWTRPNNVGPSLVLTPLAVCPSFEDKAAFRPAMLEYADEEGVYVHSAAAGAETRKNGGNWRQPHTNLVLTAADKPGSEAVYGFKFRWADGYDGIRNVLVEEGLFDVQVVPGMTVPSDLEALFSVRTKTPIEAVAAEFPAQTKVEDLGLKADNVHLYRVRFSRLGENMLTINAGSGRKTYLEFFVTEPLEMLTKKRAAFLAGRQLLRDPLKWYDGLFSDWDMKAQVLRSPDDTDGLKDYYLASDDPGLCKAPYIAEKNVHFPSATEVEAVEYHIKNFVWGKLQRTDKETHPYGIYGIENWKMNRDSRPADRNGWTEHLWRLYDYPHVVMLYLDMYKIAKFYPDLTKYLDWSGYLQRAFGTAKALFTVPLGTGNWPATAIGLFNELVLVDLIDALEKEKWTPQADWLRRRWEEKVEHFINDKPDFFHAEYPFGPCAFESTHAFAKYALANAGRPGSTLQVTAQGAAAFMEEQIQANILLRGWLETSYFLLGSSSPGSLFYMSQMGGWSLVDYALTTSPDPQRYLRLGYASLLSAWALMNTGTPESNYGFWYPGPKNDGGAGTGFIMQAFGEKMGKAVGRGVWNYGGEADLGFGAALRTAATIVTDDPIFGLIAYGGTLIQSGSGLEVVPKDGLRQRFHLIRGTRRLRVELDRDGFAKDKPLKFNEALTDIELPLENRSGDRHETALTLTGLPEGVYRVLLSGSPLSPFRAEGTKPQVLRLPLPAAGETLLRLQLEPRR
jgi:hypothetical protein